MKKLFSLILILVMLCPLCAVADFDFSSFDFDALTISEMVLLRARLITEIMKRDDFEEVLVPQGLYEIGVDIPAGKWTVRCADNGRQDFLMRETWLFWGIGKPDADFFWPIDREKSDVEIYNPRNEEYVHGEVTEFTIELEDGDFLYIHPAYNAAIFSTPVGPSFKFR